jgi:hypothetical protein
MKLRKSAISLQLASTLAAASIAYAAGPHTEHVLLISVDGLHALDVARFIEGHPASAMAELARHGITYSNASTPAHTDSFPGLLALVTGGSPVSQTSPWTSSRPRNCRAALTSVGTAFQSSRTAS